MTSRQRVREPALAPRSLAAATERRSPLGAEVGQAAADSEIISPRALIRAAGRIVITPADHLDARHGMDVAQANEVVNTAGTAVPSIVGLLAPDKRL
jgi:hypothetical protein